MDFLAVSRILIAYLVLINVVAFVAFGVDKWKAQRGAWRIPELTLLLLAALGGSVGAWLGMRVWRHKTQHLKFLVGIPAIFVLQILLAWWILYK